MEKIQIMHIVGNRPQFIKLAPLSRELKKRGYHDEILHTGQHYDSNMSDIFFEELAIKKPYKNLGVGSGTHAEMTGKAMIAIEHELLERQPDVVILYGDTDSTLAAGLAAAKLNIPMVHVESGIRSGLKSNPEECNRMIVDRLSAVCCCSDLSSIENLKKEGITAGVYHTGDIMYDTYRYTVKQAENMPLPDNLEEENYILMTWHRQENTESRERMEQILRFISKINCRIICPIHPRTRDRLKKTGLLKYAGSMNNLTLTEPIGYFEMVKLMNFCKLILTDSGGLSKEAYFAGVKCLFMLDAVLWQDLYEDKWIQNIDFNREESVQQAVRLCNQKKEQNCCERKDYYGKGNTAEKIVNSMERKGLIK